MVLCIGANATQALDFSLGAKAGTLGLGLELATSISPNVNARLVANGFNIDYDAEFDDIDYELEVDLFSTGLLLDWFPNAGKFRITGGILYNGNEADAEAESQEQLEIGDTTYSPNEIGTLLGSADFDEIAPYFGIGWGNPFTDDGRWSINIDIGVLYVGSPEIGLTSSNGTLSSNPTLLNDLKKEEGQFEDDADDFGFYPVLSLAILYRF